MALVAITEDVIHVIIIKLRRRHIMSLNRFLLGLSIDDIFQHILIFGHRASNNTNHPSIADPPIGIAFERHRITHIHIVEVLEMPAERTHHLLVLLVVHDHSHPLVVLVQEDLVDRLHDCWFVGLSR